MHKWQTKRNCWEQKQILVSSSTPSIGKHHQKVFDTTQGHLMIWTEHLTQSHFMIFQHRGPPGGPQEHTLGGFYHLCNEGSYLVLSPLEVDHWGAQTWHRFWMFRLYLKTSLHHPMRNCPIVTFFCKTWKFSECKSYRARFFFPICTAIPRYNYL